MSCMRARLERGVLVVKARAEWKGVRRRVGARRVRRKMNIVGVVDGCGCVR